jgi:hypothetical protein
MPAVTLVLATALAQVQIPTTDCAIALTRGTSAATAQVCQAESELSKAAARVLKSVPLLDEAALQAVKEWRYDPTLVNGKPVPIKMTVTVNFSTRR